MSASTQLSFFEDEPEPEEECKPFQFDLFACFEKQHGHIVLNHFVLFKKKAQEMSAEEQSAVLDTLLEMNVLNSIDQIKHKVRVIEDSSERIVDKWLSRIMRS